MKGYFHNSRDILLENIPDRLPIKPEQKSDWLVKKNPNRYHRKFKIKNKQAFKEFIIALLDYEASSNHNAKILIGYPDIIIEVWTHTLEDITQMDQEYIKEVDHLYNETS